MKKDLRNVVMTVGGIALSLSVGTYAYYSRADVGSDTTGALSVEEVVVENNANPLKTEDAVKEIVQATTTAPEPEPVELPKPKVTPVTTAPVVVPTTPKTTTPSPTTTTIVATTTKTTVATATAPTKPSRKSRAS